MLSIMYLYQDLVHEQDISLGNTIKIVKMNLINSMRNDLGIA